MGYEVMSDADIERLPVWLRAGAVERAQALLEVQMELRRVQEQKKAIVSAELELASEFVTRSEAFEAYLGGIKEWLENNPVGGEYDI